jgi:hypothetical protein
MEKGKTNKEVEKKTEQRNKHKNIQRLKTGRDSVLINRKLKRH